MQNNLRFFLSSILCIGIVLGSFGSWEKAFARRGATTRAARTIEWNGEKHIYVVIDIGAGTVDLRRNSTGDILNAEVEYDPDEVRIDIDYDRQKEKGELYLVSERRNKGLHLDTEDSYWYLEFSDLIPISFEIDIGACEAEFDFSGLRVDGLDMDLGASSVDVEFRELNSERISKIRIDVGASELNIDGLGNANFEKLSFDGGVGDFTLDFSGDFTHRAYVEVDVGLGSLDIFVPRDAGVQIKCESSFLSSVSIDEDDFEEVEDDLYESDNFGQTQKELIFEVEVGLGSVEVEYTGR